MPTLGTSSLFAPTSRGTQAADLTGDRGDHRCCDGPHSWDAWSCDTRNRSVSLPVSIDDRPFRLRATGPRCAYLRTAAYRHILGRLVYSGDAGADSKSCGR